MDALVQGFLKIFLKVSHPTGELIAGDITISNKNGKYNSGNRNIVGITNNLNRSNIFGVPVNTLSPTLPQASHWNLHQRLLGTPT